MSRPQRGAFAGARFKSKALFAALVSLAAIAVSQAALATHAAAAETTVSEGRLLWGVKESWRKYIALGSEAADGATVTGWQPGAGGGDYAEGFSFPVVSGSFDDGTDTTKLQFGGYAHFKAYCDAEPPHRCLLDTKYSDLELEIGPEAQVLRGTHTGYLRTDPGGALHVDEDVVLAKYDISGATTSFTGGVSKWAGIPTVAGPGNGLYVESTVVDSTSFEYTGPGGVPDLSEKWDTPGAPGLASGNAWVADPGTSTRVLHPSEQDAVVHVVDLVGAETSGAKLVFSALDATTLQPAGTPYTWAFPGAVQGDLQALRTAFDPATDSVFFASYNEGAGHDEASIHRASWDEATQSYAVEAVGGLGPMGPFHRVGGMVWNPIEDELAVTAFAGSASDGIYATDLLHRFRLENGTWSDQSALLRLPDSGEWAGASAVDGPFAAASFLKADAEPLAVARDGSYVHAGSTGVAIVGGEDRHYPALHVAVAGNGSATVAPIAGTTTPRTVFGTYYGFASLATAPDGSLLLHNSSQVMDAYAHIDVSAGTAARIGSIVDAPVDAFPPYELSGFANSIATDSGHGIVWATDTFSAEGFQLNALRGDEFIGRFGYADFPQSDSKGAFARLAVAPDGDLYLPIRDSASGLPGYRHLDFTGFVPKLSAQPQDQAVVLGPGEAAKAVQFSVAVANAGDAIQWQSKSPGASAFADLPGATAVTLAVAAKPASDGTVYRAVVSSAAGKIASAEADLEVEYAPVVVSDLLNREVTEGGQALFVLSADGNPELQVQWQRRVGGFWESIPAGDENFAVNGPSLTVLETNLEQSGALFRAKLSNSAGDVFTKQAKLTVNPKTTIPAEGIELDHVSLDWSGNAEMQHKPPFGNSNYFSAGISGGNEATYSAAAGNARVFQVAAGGGEALATWASRGNHVLGGSQLVRLYGGSGKVEQDGSATVLWNGAFSVNFYDGLVPFTLSNPELEVDGDGDGTLSADLAGCSSSMANPKQCDPMAPVLDVTVATFSGVEVDPAGAVEIEPDFSGVEVTAPAGMAPQNRSAVGWGAWPQEFVDFHGLTGLGPYWYSSGGSADPMKRPDPLLVDFDGETLPAAPPVGDPGPGGSSSGGGGGSNGAATPGESRPPVAPKPATIAAAKGVQALDSQGRATLATLTCAGSEPCAVSAPRRVSVRVGEKTFRARVIVPRTIAAGASAPLRVKLPSGVLGSGRVRVEVPVTVLSAGQRLRWTAGAWVRGTTKTKATGRTPRTGAGSA